MPYKSEKIRLPEALDRRRRLSDADKAEILRSLFGWCVLLFAMASVSGVMEWNGAYMVFQSVCFGICVLGVALYFAWIVLYGIRQ